MLLTWFFVCLLAQWSVQQDEAAAHSNLTDIYIMGMVTSSDQKGAGGLSVRVGMEMALEHINARPDILPDYRLNLVNLEDGGCHVGIGLDAMYQMLKKPPAKLMFVGAGCSPVSQVAAKVARIWNVPQLSYQSNSPALSDKSEYPWFFRISESSLLFIPPIVELMRQHKWRKVATIYESWDAFVLMTRFLMDEMMANADTEIVASEAFTTDPYDAVAQVKLTDARIIVGSFLATSARKVLCEAFKQGLYGRKYVWIFTAYYGTQWWMLDDDLVTCTKAEMSMMVENVFHVASVYSNPKQQKGVANLTPFEFTQLFEKKVNYTKQVTEHLAPNAYDTVWVAAMALDATIRELKEQGSSFLLEHFDYHSGKAKTIGHKLVDQMRKTKFIGVSKASVSFDENHDPIGVVQIVQIKKGKNVIMGYYDPLSVLAKATGTIMVVWVREIEWPENKVPYDAVRFVSRSSGMSEIIYMIFCSICLGGIVLSFGFLGYGLFNRSKKFFKNSMPVFNNTFLLGCSLCLITPAFHAVGAGAAEDTTVIFCRIRGYMLSGGFSLAFGPLLAKLWRMHCVYTNRGQEDLKNIIANDMLLYGIVASITVTNMGMLVVWDFLDALVTKRINVAKEITEDGDMVADVYQLVCESDNQEIFMGIIFTFNAILIILCAFFTLETREVTMKKLNDSRSVGLAIYNIALASFIGAPMTFLLADKPEVNFAMLTICIIFGTVGAELIIFLPKVKRSLFRAVVGPDGASSFSGGSTSQGSQSGGSHSSQTMQNKNANLGGQMNVMMHENAITLKQKVAEWQELKDQVDTMKSEIRNRQKINEAAMEQ